MQAIGLIPMFWPKAKQASRLPLSCRGRLLEGYAPS
jgi:hypothetical protein